MNIFNSIQQTIGSYWYVIPIVIGGLVLIALRKFFYSEMFHAFTIGAFVAITIVFIMIFKGCTPIQIPTSFY